MRSERELCGNITAGTKTRVIVDDGKFTDAWEVVGFDVFAENGLAPDAQAILALDQDGLTSKWDAGDNRQIGWAFMFTGTNGGSVHSWIRKHVVCRDLWIENFGPNTLNYIIRVQRRELSEDQAILALIQERSQDDL